MGAEKKKAWAARLARRHARNRRPPPAPKAPREKRAPRELVARPDAAQRILSALVGRQPAPPSRATLLAAALVGTAVAGASRKGSRR